MDVYFILGPITSDPEMLVMSKSSWPVSLLQCVSLCLHETGMFSVTFTSPAFQAGQVHYLQLQLNLWSVAMATQFFNCKCQFERCEVIPSAAIRVTSWSCGMCEHVFMHAGLCPCVPGFYGSKSRCHLVILLSQLNCIPDDLEAARNSKVSKSTCRNTQKCPSSQAVAICTTNSMWGREGKMAQMRKSFVTARE